MAPNRTRIHWPEDMSPPTQLALRTMVAVLAMVMVIAIMASGLFGVGGGMIAASIVLVHAIIGLVLYFLIHRWRAVRYRDAAFAGLLIGVVPAMLYNLLSALHSYGLHTVMTSARDGEVWLGLGLMALVFGGFGALAGLIFLFVVQGRC